jgi:4-hydroxy-3-methylbut-2-enyl diphosphate reductase
MGIKNLAGDNPDAAVDDLGPEDVVIVPAFGTTTRMMDRIKGRGCQIVDTTCGDVMSVWKRVRNYAKEEVTSIIHGKSYHEETKATASRALGSGGGGHYLVVLDLNETDYVCDYIRNGGDKQAFLTKFKDAHSPDFDPDRDLVRIGVANQTTMLRGETEEVQRRLSRAIADRHGADQLPAHFRVFDTICGATQERQDALTVLLKEKLDLVVVIGGYNSSNTNNLARIASKFTRAFHVENASSILSADEIRHKLPGTSEERHTRGWLGEGKRTIGLTAGASTPNNQIGEAVERIVGFRDTMGLSQLKEVINAWSES